MKLGPRQQRWVEALRSGSYTQGQEALHAGNAFCCLGVACDVFKDELSLSVKSEDGIVHYDGQALVLPTAVKEHLHLAHKSGIPKSKKGYTSLSMQLSALNDSGASFEEIADTIEQYADEYFTESV